MNKKSITFGIIKKFILEDDIVIKYLNKKDLINDFNTIDESRSITFCFETDLTYHGLLNNTKNSEPIVYSIFYNTVPTGTLKALAKYIMNYNNTCYPDE